MIPVIGPPDGQPAYVHIPEIRKLLVRHAKDQVVA